jgi:hypothetical protein
MKMKVLVMIFSVLALPILLFAQNPPPPADFEGESPYGVTDVQVPIDQWVIVLFVATIVYGIYRAKANKKMKMALK